MNTKGIREIRFRAWFEGVNLMGNVITMKGSNRNGYVGNMWDEVTAECYENGRQQFYTSYNFILMQYTGMKDKNGKEIYEGDVVKWDDHSGGQYWRVAVVYWDDDECMHCFRCIKNTLHPLSTKDGYVFGSNFSYRTKANAARELIKVGNIYETPNLLSQ